MKIIVQGRALEYADEGEGPTLLFLHGWKDDLRTFDALAGGLAGYRIVRLDMPGFGGSDAPPAAWDLSSYVGCVAAFIERLKLEPAAIVGHSMGGRVAIKGVSEGVFRPGKMVLIASAGIAKRRTWKSAFLAALAKAGKALTAVPPLSMWRHRLRRSLYHAIGSDYFAAGELKGTFLKIVAEDLAEAAGRISIPALLVWGSEDASTPLADGRRLSTLIPNARLEVLRGAGHFVHRERAQEVAALIRDFI